MSIYGYARSTVRGTEKQEHFLTFAGCDRVFADAGSGRGAAWQLCLDTIKPGDLVRVAGLTRLGRTVADIRQAALQVQIRGATLEAPRDQIELLTKLTGIVREHAGVRLTWR